MLQDILEGDLALQSQFAIPGGIIEPADLFSYTIVETILMGSDDGVRPPRFLS